jgi:phage regulator Rha-like protein
MKCTKHEARHDSVIRAIIALMMEAENTSETSVNFYQTTRRNNPEDSHFYTRRR